ncbi:MAG: cyclic nucleotide-binding domain-containing protein [Coriobacteriia bacterium]|nr:cyclic nucleotide-binding domain-containing protein [Coriobacteriia bacterium]
MPCCDNRFCRSLEDADRAELCRICARSHFEKDALLPQEPFEAHLMLIVSGALTTIKAANGKMQYLYCSGDIIGHEYLFNERRIKYTGYGLLQAFRDLEVAWFPTMRLRELFYERPGIARALYMNVSVMDNRKAYYRIMVSLEDAYHAVLYMMLYLQRRGISTPSHAELAFLCGLNRVTVTRVLKEILRSEPYEDLREYMESELGRLSFPD